MYLYYYIVWILGLTVEKSMLETTAEIEMYRLTDSKILLLMICWLHKCVMTISWKFKTPNHAGNLWSTFIKFSNYRYSQRRYIFKRRKRVEKVRFIKISAKHVYFWWYISFYTTNIKGLTTCWHKIHPGKSHFDASYASCIFFCWHVTKSWASVRHETLCIEASSNNNYSSWLPASSSDPRRVNAGSGRFVRGIIAFISTTLCLLIRSLLLASLHSPAFPTSFTLSSSFKHSLYSDLILLSDKESWPDPQLLTVIRYSLNHWIVWSDVQLITLLLITRYYNEIG